MKKLPVRVHRKKEMGRLYERLLSGIAEAEVLPVNYNTTPPWFFDILCENRNGLMAYLKEKGIGTRAFYPPLHSEPVYGYNEQSFPVTEEISSKGLWLPSGIAITDEQIKYVCSEIEKYYKGDGKR